MQLPWSTNKMNNYKYATKTSSILLSTATLWFLLGSRGHNHRLSTLVTRLYRSIPIHNNHYKNISLLHNLSSHCHESSFDISTVLCWGLNKLNTKRISKLLSSFIRNHLFGGQISLVTNKKLDNILISITINFMKPSLHIVEGILVSHIINNNDAMSSTIVGRSNSTETFLTSSIPLQVKPSKSTPTIWSFTVFPSRSTVRIFYNITILRGIHTKSTPMVVM